MDAVLFLFSFTDRTSFDDLSNQIAKWTGTSSGRVVKLVVGTKYPFVPFLFFFILKFNDFITVSVRELNICKDILRNEQSVIYTERKSMQL